MELPLSDKQKIKLISFINENFSKLPEKVKEDFKTRDLFPGKGHLSDYSEYSSLLLVAKSSAKTAYKYHKDMKLNVTEEISVQLVNQSIYTIQSILFKFIEECATPITGNLINVLRMCSIERTPSLIMSKKVADNIGASKSFRKLETKPQLEGIIHKIGTWKNVSIYIHPLLNEDDITAYLIYDTVIDYRIIETNDEELLKIEDIGHDLNITFSPALLQYRLSPEDNYKVFKIKKLLYE